MDKPVTITKPFAKVVNEARQMALLSDEDVRTLLYLIAVLERPIVDIRYEMSEHPRLRAVIGYYFRNLSQVAKDYEEMMESSWLRVYNSLYATKYSAKMAGKTSTLAKTSEGMGRFTDKLVTAQALQDPAFAALREKVCRLKYLADQLSELVTAYNARTRFLEQHSNHMRFEMRSDKEEQTH